MGGPGVPDHTHINELNQIYFCTICLTTCKTKIHFQPKIILINFIPMFILTCCFESLWARVTPATWNDWINLLLLLIPYHLRETNFMTQLILEIKLATIYHHFGHVKVYLTIPTWSNQSIFVALWTSSHIQKFNFIPQLICEIF